MGNLKIWIMRESYIKFLHNIDRRVQYNKGERRPYVGIVLKVGEHDYFVPMESPKPNHKNLKNNLHIFKLKGGEYGILGFNNMIPAKDFFLMPIDIDNEPDAQYRELLKNQILFCNDHKKEIYMRAQKTYEGVTIKKIPFLCRISCDFKLLEKQYTKFVFKSSEK